MSGSVRAITLTLSVRDADKVRQELEKIGPAGESAINRLDAAARRAAGNGGGVQALATATGETSNKFGNIRQVIGSAGFQLQDFAVQVQGGTSALTALSQQGSQFLGVFGPAGAIAGAVLSVGILAAQFFGMGETAEQEIKRIEANFEGMKRTADDVKKVLQEINDLFLGAGEASALAANRQRQNLIEETRRLLDLTVQRNEGNALELTQARRELAEREAAIARRDAEIRARTGARTNEFQQQDQSTLFPLRQRVAGLEADLGRSSERIGQLNEALTRAQNAGVAGPEVLGPPNPLPEQARQARASAAEEARRLREEQQQLNDMLREQQNILRANETPYERYQRQLEELAALQDRLNEAEQRGVEVNGVRVRALSTEELARTTERFATELERTEKAAKDADDIGRSLGLTFSSAFEDAIIKGKEFREILQAIAQDIARLIIRKSITEPVGAAVTNSLKGVSFSGIFDSIFGGSSASAARPGVMSSASGPLYSANGNVFFGGNVVPFAAGGVVQRPTVFPMANGGVGLMGEAGPEAIMPLRRDSAGRLGVAGGGGGTVIQQTINVDARGADSGVDQKIRAGVAVAVQQANAQLLAEINRGGSVAKQVGRRA